MQHRDNLNVIHLNPPRTWCIPHAHIIMTTSRNMKASEESDPLESHYEQETKEQMAEQSGGSNSDSSSSECSLDLDVEDVL
jgi:hypothetical protein